MNKKCSICDTENPLHAKYCRRCGKRFDDEPEIADFRLNAVYRVGDVVDFSWDVTNADIVTLNGVVVTGKTHISITIKGDEDFKLVARKGTCAREKTISVHPLKSRESCPKPSVNQFLSILRRKRWTVLFGFLTLAALLVVLLNDNMIPSYFNIGYSGWQNMKPVIIVLCCVIIAFCIGSMVYTRNKNIPK